MDSQPFGTRSPLHREVDLRSFTFPTVKGVKGEGGGGGGEDHVSHKINWAFRVSRAKKTVFSRVTDNIWLFHDENSLITEALDLSLIPQSPKWHSYATSHRVLGAIRRKFSSLLFPPTS